MGREQLLLDFIPEGFELIEVCESAILSIEEINDQSGEYDEDLINNLFRAVHTFKGSTGLLKLESLVKISHEAETLMDILRKEKNFLMKTFVKYSSTPVINCEGYCIKSMKQKQIQS